MPGWDNTARRQDLSYCFEHSTPGASRRGGARHRGDPHTKSGEERIVFVNAWNEWRKGRISSRIGGSAHLSRSAKEREGRCAPEAPRPLRAQLNWMREQWTADWTSADRHPFAPIGMGEHVRCSFRAFRSVGVEPRVIDIYGLNPRSPMCWRRSSRSCRSRCARSTYSTSTATKSSRRSRHWSIEEARHSGLTSSIRLGSCRAIRRSGHASSTGSTRSGRRPIHRRRAARCSLQTGGPHALACEVIVSSFLGRRRFGIPETAYAFLFFLICARTRAARTRTPCSRLSENCSREGGSPTPSSC